ncbi:MAG: hypothetical protein PHY59_06095 [Methanobacterium sp.]|nr:hypothetical protein [Methanobacterium sp.]
MVYNIIMPVLPFIGIYLLTYCLYRMDLIKKALHVNIWNLIIGSIFLISAGAGFVLLLLMEFGVVLPISSQLLYWHVELGMSLFLVTIFHFHTYWKSSQNIVVKKRLKIWEI